MLCGMSVLFYAWGNAAYVPLLLAAAFSNYLFALLVPAVGGKDGNPSCAASEGAPAERTPAKGVPAGGAPAEGVPAKGAPAEGAMAEGTPSDVAAPRRKGSLRRERASDEARRVKAVLVACIVFNILLLCVFKYANFIVENIDRISGAAIPNPGIPLPIGISFFTFQAMSYVMDVCAGRTKAQKDPAAMLLYVSFFPQLIAGPIVRYVDIEPNLRARSASVKETAYGIRRFIFGLSKKLLIANSVGAVADAVFGAGGAASLSAAAGGASLASAAGSAIANPLSCPVAWLGAIAYAMQIYFDFSGYSDMAIGLGKMFGFSFLENFDYPYSALGIRDFWRRWHISLSTWFRDYVYIPLGGNRRGKFREARNKVIVFFLTGLWHGASWTFVVWGLFHGAFIALESYGAIKPGRMPKPIAWLYTMLVVVVGFVVFRADTLADAGKVLSAMFFGVGGIGGAVTQLAQAARLLRPSALPAFAAAAAAAFPLTRSLARRSRKLQAAGFALSAPLFFLCVLDLATSTYNPFIYYRF